MKTLMPQLRERKGTIFKRRLAVQICAVLLAALMLIPILPPNQQVLADPLPVTQVFDLSDSSDPSILKKNLQRSTVLQSFGYDNVNQHIYTVQLIGGGLQLPGESSAPTAAVRKTNGDLCITKLDFAGNIISYMYVLGAGHGVSIGVEPGIGQSGQPVAYLWTETDGVPDSVNGARGTKIARFPFTDGAVVTPNTPWLQKHTLVPGSTNATVSIDMKNGYLVSRYKATDGNYKLSLFDLAQVKLGNYVVRSTINMPAVDTTVTSFQGYTSYGNYAYLLEGTAYGNGNSVAPNGNTYISIYDFNTGALVNRGLTKAGYSLLYREPEGMAIQIPNPSTPGYARLSFGFASYVSTTDTSKQASIYYKDVLH
ncbi:phage baseplate protein [Paenibacillus sp. FSL H8-0034]|uniref:phage baseplate protein n=1 Tax=Paenibacillus sp. FSL H8-0034 TaxID=2954671 RepID=UPI0030F9F05C